MGQRPPFGIWINAASETLKGDRSTRATPRLSEEIRAERKSSENQGPIEGKRTRATKILKFLRKAPRKRAETKMADSGVLEISDGSEYSSQIIE